MGEHVAVAAAAHAAVEDAAASMLPWPSALALSMPPLRMPPPGDGAAGLLRIRRARRGSAMSTGHRDLIEYAQAHASEASAGRARRSAALKRA